MTAVGGDLSLRILEAWEATVDLNAGDWMEAAVTKTSKLNRAKKQRNDAHSHTLRCIQIRQQQRNTNLCSLQWVIRLQSARGNRFILK